MTAKYFIHDDLIPNDGSKEIINLFSEKLNQKDSELIFFPDVHYKKGSRVVNGMLFASDTNILPSMLGVANCGFTFGQVKSNDIEKIKNSFENYSKLLKDYEPFEEYSWNKVENLFKEYLEKDFKNNNELYKFCGIENFEQAFKKFKSMLTKKMKQAAMKTLCSLGGGNHFFEIHKVEEAKEQNKDFNKDDYIFILHSDSIRFGCYIYDLYSNLTEWGKPADKGARKFRRKFRRIQFKYFFKRFIFFKSPLELCKLIYNLEDYRLIKAKTAIGKDLMFAHNIASLFGDMNRDLIIQNFAKTQNIEMNKIGSHSHDSVNIEDGKIVQRNGVQYVGKDKYFVLPSAMGNYSYILQNTTDKDSYYSTNHGCGRTQDKHIAKENFTDNDTVGNLKDSGISLFRVGKGSMAEQNCNAFKDVDTILNEMEKYNLGKEVAKTKPALIIKG